MPPARRRFRLASPLVAACGERASMARARREAHAPSSARPARPDRTATRAPPPRWSPRTDAPRVARPRHARVTVRAQRAATPGRHPLPAPLQHARVTARAQRAATPGCRSWSATPTRTWEREARRRSPHARQGPHPSEAPAPTTVRAQRAATPGRRQRWPRVPARSSLQRDGGVARRRRCASPRHLDREAARRSARPCRSPRPGGAPSMLELPKKAEGRAARSTARPPGAGRRRRAALGQSMQVGLERTRWASRRRPHRQWKLV
jgi:hypothetical protein